ncbi:MAG: glycosyltransferase family 4 protein [Chitinivibrionales bacterium]|nr:glycosyltransferase family 4 protein [Chitinivibrionales bacterium]
MKILYLCSADLSGEVGSMGSVRHIMEVSENLTRLGHSVTLIAPDYARYRHPTPVKIVYIPLIKRRFLRTIVSELLSPFFIAAFILVWKPAIIYWRQAYLTVFPVLLSRMLRRKIATEVNGLTIDEVESERVQFLRKMIILSFERFNYSLSDHLICVAPHIRTRLLTHYRLNPEKVSVILNGVNADRMPIIAIDEAKRKIGIDPSVYTIGFVGHLFPWDGVEYLIEAAPAVIAAIGTVKFVIIGHGQWGTHLKGLVTGKKLDEYFLFTGKVAWEELYVYVNAFDIATAPYGQKINAESGRSSLKILEYFACKKPVVASQTSVIPEITDLQEKNLGMTVPAENSQALAEALITLCNDSQLRSTMGAGGREYVVSQRSWMNVAQKTDIILKKLLSLSKE